MNTDSFEKLARAHLIKLCLIFSLCFLIALGCSAIADWAHERHGWESETVGFIFYALSGILGLGVLISGISIYGWFNSYAVAKSDAHYYDLETLQKLRSDVIGPIQWK